MRSLAGCLSLGAFSGQAIRIAKQNGERVHIDDQRRELPEVDFSFNGILKPFQQEAVTAILKKDFGTLQAPTGSGKTVMALDVIVKRKQPALIVVHTKELLTQWIERIESFLDIPKAEIGIIGNGKDADRQQGHSGTGSKSIQMRG